VIYSLRRECSKADSVARISLKASSGPGRIALLFHLAQCQFNAGQLDKALEYLLALQGVYDTESFLMRPIYYPKSYYLIGRIYDEKGDKELAAQNYDKFLDIWKDADEDLPDLIDAKARRDELDGTIQK
jgi:tetratricopeptide (TPR) repeat protein